MTSAMRQREGCGTTVPFGGVNQSSSPGEPLPDRVGLDQVHHLGEVAPPHLGPLEGARGAAAGDEPHAAETPSVAAAGAPPPYSTKRAKTKSVSRAAWWQPTQVAGSIRTGLPAGSYTA